jgi:hypothetical protein
MYLVVQQIQKMQSKNIYTAAYLTNKWKSQQSSFPTNITNTLISSQITGKSLRHPQQVSHPISFLISKASFFNHQTPRQRTFWNSPNHT